MKHYKSFLVANKIDSEVEEREVTKEDGEEFAKKNGMLLFETSAVTGQNVDHLFFQLARNLMELKLKCLYRDHLQRQGEGEDAIWLPSDSERQQQEGWGSWCCGRGSYMADNVAARQSSPAHAQRNAPASSKHAQLATTTLSRDMDSSSQYYFSSPFETKQFSLLNYSAISQGALPPGLATAQMWGVQTDGSCGTSSFVLLGEIQCAVVLIL